MYLTYMYRANIFEFLEIEADTEHTFTEPKVRTKPMGTPKIVYEEEPSTEETIWLSRFTSSLIIIFTAVSLYLIANRILILSFYSLLLFRRLQHYP